MIPLIIKGTAQGIILLMLLGVIYSELKTRAAIKDFIFLNMFILLFYLAGCFSVLDSTIIKVWSYMW